MHRSVEIKLSYRGAGPHGARSRGALLEVNDLDVEFPVRRTKIVQHGRVGTASWRDDDVRGQDRAA